MGKDKIGVLTFYNTLNYGAFLQMYALQKYMHSVGINAEIVRYNCNTVTLRESVPKLTDAKDIKEFIKASVEIPVLKRKYKAFTSDFKRLIKASKEIYDKNNIIKSNQEYSAFVFGSDQVWNLKLTGNDITFFGDFVNEENYMFSYAASIGEESFFGLENIIKNELNRYLAISVREKQAEDILRKMGIQCELVLDPIFLLSRDEWAEILSDVVLPKKLHKDYIVIYQMTSSSHIYEFVDKLAKENDCYIINANPFFKDRFRYKNIEGISALQWLKLLNDAKYIVTNSFHGLAFSICLNKQFYTEIVDFEQQTSSRLTSLLALFNLEEKNILSKNLDLNKIDYSRINKILAIHIQKSKEYIKREIYNDKVR